MLLWDRKPFASSVAEYLCRVWDSKSTLIFVPFASPDFNPFLQRETAIGITLGFSSCVLPQQKTIIFLVCALLVGRINSLGLSLLPFVLTGWGSWDFSFK